MALPWKTRLRMWRRGFLSASWVLYDLGGNDSQKYLSDLAQAIRLRGLNGGYAESLDNGFLLHRLLTPWTAWLPTLHGALVDSAVMTSEGVVPRAEVIEWLLALLHENAMLSIDHLRDSLDARTNTLWIDRNAIKLNGRPIEEDDLIRFVWQAGDCLIREHVIQHDALSRLYRRTNNTVRLVMLQDAFCDAFIAAAILRIGTSRSEPADRWRRGAFSARIDIGNGRVGKAALYPVPGRPVEWCDIHPQGGAAIEGLTIPHWDRIAEGMLDLMRALPVLRLVGWDLLVTERGFRILRATAEPDIDVLQVHSPLLLDERVAACFDRWGVA